MCFNIRGAWSMELDYSAVMRLQLNYLIPSFCNLIDKLLKLSLALVSSYDKQDKARSCREQQTDLTSVTLVNLTERKFISGRRRTVVRMVSITLSSTTFSCSMLSCTQTNYTMLMFCPVRQNPIQRSVKLFRKLRNYTVLHNTT